MTTANEMTANKAKANLRSLLDKVNKETGKEHSNLSEGVETLVLGFGVDKTEVFDGVIELEGEFEPGEPEITDYYEAGYKDAQNSRKKTLYGTYVLKEPINTDDLPSGIEENFKGKGVYTYFYDWRIKDYQYLAVDLVTQFGAYEWETYVGDVQFLKYVGVDGMWGTDVDVNGITIHPDAKGRIIVFTEPTEVSEDFYNLFTQSIDTEIDIFGEGDRQFWDSALPDGVISRRMFASPVWNDITFRPTKNISLKSAVDVFTYIESATTWSCTVTDLEACLAHNDVYLVIDRDNIGNLFRNIYTITKIGRLKYNYTITSLSYTFNGASSLVTIVEPIPVTSATIFTNAFGNCKKLRDVRFTGVIGKNIIFQQSNDLSHDSLINVLECLEDKSTDTSGTIGKFTIGSTNLAKLTEEELNIAYQKGWEIY